VSKTRNDSGQDKPTTSENAKPTTSSTITSDVKSQNISIAVSKSLSPPNDRKNDKPATNTNGVFKHSKDDQKKEKIPRKTSNIENKSSDHIYQDCTDIPRLYLSTKTVKRANSYAASSYNQTNSNISPSNSEEHRPQILSDTQENKDNPDIQITPAPGCKELPFQPTDYDTSRLQSGEHSKNISLRTDDNKDGINRTGHDNLSSITKRSSTLHGAAQTPKASTLSRLDTSVTTRERRASCCYAGSVDGVSTADLFSDHRDDSGIPRLSFKGEHSDPELSSQGKILFSNDLHKYD
jgi:hypothetical protein